MRPAAGSISWLARSGTLSRGNGPNGGGWRIAPARAGVVASQALVAAPPDGTTLIVVASGHATNPFRYAKIPYDTVKDFTPISLLASSPNILLVLRGLSLQESGRSDRAGKGKTRRDSPLGMPATAPRRILRASSLKNLAKIDAEAIPYKGGAARDQRSAGRTIPLSFNNGPESVGQIEAGTVRALAVTTATRAPFLPDVPSIGETVPGLRHRGMVGSARSRRYAARPRGNALA